MQITPQNNLPLPTPATVQPQAIRQIIHPPAAPTIAPRAIDSGDKGSKGSATSSATQKETPAVRTGNAKPKDRGDKLDVLV